MKKSIQVFALMFLFVIGLKAQDNNEKRNTAIEPAPGSSVVSDINIGTGNNPAAWGSRWFAENAAATSFFTKGFLNSSASHTNFGSSTTALFGAMEFDNTGKLYCINVAASSPLQILDTITGVLSAGTPITGVTGQVLGMAFNTANNMMYLSVVDGSTSDKLYTLNLTTGAGTLVGGTNANLFDIAINSAGQCYGVTITDNLVSIDLTTGNSTVIGPIGFDANFIQGLSFDRSTDSLWYACYNQTAGRGELRKVNLTSGATVLVGPFNPAAEICGFCIPSAAPPPSSCNRFSSQWCSAGTFPALPAPAYFQASAWMGDTLYVQCPTSAGAGDVTVNRYTYGGSWSAGVPLPSPKVGGAMVKCNNKLYYVGGGPATMTTGGNELLEYSSSSGTWVTKAPLPAALSGHGAVCWGDSVIFVVGGPYTGSATNLNVHYYRVASDTWGTITSSLPAGMGRRTFGLGISGNKIVVSAGFNTAFLKSTLIGAIGSNASSITWTSAPDVPTPYLGLSRPGAAYYGDLFFLVNGERAGIGGYYDTTHVYQFSSNSWITMITGKPYKMSNICNAVTARCINDTVKLFVPGGYGSISGGTPGTATNQFDVVGCGPYLVGVSNQIASIPGEYSLKQNYPNPFNPATKISYTIPVSGLVTLKVYDILGKEIANLVNEFKNAGNYNVIFNASNLSSGVYFYRLESGNFVETKRMSFLK